MARIFAHLGGGVDVAPTIDLLVDLADKISPAYAAFVTDKLRWAAYNESPPPGYPDSTEFKAAGYAGVAGFFKIQTDGSIMRVAPKQRIALLQLYRR
jgi:hypothetical protein